MMSESKRQEIEARINQLAKENRGRITPELVITEAADPDSPLHDQFEWDDAKAAAHHRLDQARALIRSVRIMVTTESRKIRSVAYVRDPDAGPEQGYVSIVTLKKSRDKAVEAVRYEATRAHSAMQRARDVSEALGIVDEVDAIIERIDGFREKLTE